EYPIVLGKPWMEYNRVVVVVYEEYLFYGRAGLKIPALGKEEVTPLIKEIRIARLVMGVTFGIEIKRIRRNYGLRIAEAAIIKVSIIDIDKALHPKKEYTWEELKSLIPVRLYQYLPLFLKEEAARLLPRRPGIDHYIEFKKDKDGKELPLPWGPLYGISRDELLVLRKTITDL